ncbi:MAG: 4Fe-4S dicluster domain-containing protein [Acidobacteriota bacterium]
MNGPRRRFLGCLGLAGLSLAGGRSLLAALREDARPWDASELAGLTGRRWAMAVDVRACVEHPECTRCLDACRQAHNVPSIDEARHAIAWIWKEPRRHVLPELEPPWAGDAPHEDELPVLCNHCDRPPCVRVCPTGATWRRDDGLVMMDWHRCIGCRYCMAACPYGSRSFNWVDPRPHVAQVDPSFPTRTRGVVEKCNFCEERLGRGELPACVVDCPWGCLVFGDLLDPESPVRRRVADRLVARRKPFLGTEPQVLYLV